MRSTIFSNYNRLKGRASPEYIPRLNRALGVAQRKEPRPYETTFFSCTCPDFYYRGVLCKHILAEWLKFSSNLAPIFKIISKKDK